MARIQSNSILFGITILSLHLFCPVAFADAKDIDAYVGTWILNVAKSRFHRARR